jgi:hypothetical protein
MQDPIAAAAHAAARLAVKTASRKVAKTTPSGKTTKELGQVSQQTDKLPPASQTPHRYGVTRRSAGP